MKEMGLTSSTLKIPPHMKEMGLTGSPLRILVTLKNWVSLGSPQVCSSQDSSY